MAGNNNGRLTNAIGESLSPAAIKLTVPRHGFHRHRGIEGELTARPFAALDGEEAHVWGVVAGVVRSLP